MLILIRYETFSVSDTARFATISRRGIASVQSTRYPTLVLIADAISSKIHRMSRHILCLTHDERGLPLSLFLPRRFLSPSALVISSRGDGNNLIFSFGFVRAIRTCHTKCVCVCVTIRYVALSKNKCLAFERSPRREIKSLPCAPRKIAREILRSIEGKITN